MIRSNIFAIVILLIVGGIAGCKQPVVNPETKNDLMPEALRIVYSVNLQDTIFPDNYKDVSEKKFINTIMDNVCSGKTQAFKAFDASEYYPYSIYESEKIDVAEIKKRLSKGKFAENVDKAPLYTEEELKTVLFIEDWFFNKQDFVFEKDVIGIVPVRSFYGDDDTLKQFPRMMKICRILPFKNQTDESIKKSKEKLVLTKKVEYEFFFNQTEALLQQIDSACFQCVKNNGEVLEDYFAPHFNTLVRKKLVNMLIEEVISKKRKAYDPWDKETVMPAKEIMPRLGAKSETIMVQDENTGELIKQEVEGFADKTQIKSVIFVEEWYLNTETLYMEKKVKGIIPIRHYYKEDDIDQEFPVKKKVFLVKFEDNDKAS